MSDNFYNSLPKKRMAVGTIFLDEQGKLLIVKPNYKNFWSVPGGIIEENESPRRACIREVREEVGLDITNPKFLCVEWTSPMSERSESLQFIFFGGILNNNQINKIRLQASEISEHKFVAPEEALKLLSEGLKHRIAKGLDVLKDKIPLYLEDGV